MTIKAVDLFPLLPYEHEVYLSVKVIKRTKRIYWQPFTLLMKRRLLALTANLTHYVT